MHINHNPPALECAKILVGDCKGYLFFTRGKNFIFFENLEIYMGRRKFIVTRREELDNIFKDIDESKKKLINPLLDNIAFLEGRMEELKKYPFIQVHPRDPSKQRSTTAAKLYKEHSQSYMNAIRMLYSMINGHEVEEDAVTKWLEERKKQNE